jgi:hypothetical protein
VEIQVSAVAEQCSFQGAEVGVDSLAYLQPYIEGFMEAEWLAAELQELESWVARNADPILQMRLLSRPLKGNVLVAAILAGRNWQRLCASGGWFDAPMGPKRLLHMAISLAVLEHKAGTWLDAAARKHLQQRLRSADNVWGVIHECATFAFLQRKSLQPEPHFLRKASRSEIVAHWAGRTVPVQCKVKLPGAGRVISKSDFVTLAGMIARDVKRSAQRLLIRIGTTGPIPHDHFEFIRRAVSDVVSGQGKVGVGKLMFSTGDRLYTVEARRLSGEFSRDEAEEVVAEAKLHIAQLIGEPTESEGKYRLEGIVGLDVDPIEHPWRSLRESILSAAKQLKDGSPGIVAVHYADVIDDPETLFPGQIPLRQFAHAHLGEFPQVAGILVSWEPDYAFPGASEPGQVRGYFDSTRLPPGFPLSAGTSIH